VPLPHRCHTGTVMAAARAIRSWLVARPLLADLVVALAALGASVPPLVNARSCGCDPAPLWAFGLVAVQCGLLLGRRRRPFTVSLLVGVCTAVYGISSLPDPAVPFAGLVAVYSAAAHATRALALLSGAGAAVGLALALILDRAHATVQDWSVNYLVFATAWLLGDAARNRREAAASLQLRAEQLERTRAAEAARAVVEERNRIAREMHDVVAHAVSLMVVQAEAGPVVVQRDPARAVAAFDAISSTGKQALSEMRGLLGVLRAGERAAHSPQPGTAGLDDLLTSMRDAGLDVHVRTSGDPRPLGSAVDLSVFRIVQEAMTNVLKHAGPARVEVELRYDESTLQVDVVDDGLGGAKTTDGSRDGHTPHGGNGLIGMRERVALVGGNLTVGPEPGGGWAVRATVPLQTRVKL
jgi:signal transduction histidine kinase